MRTNMKINARENKLFIYVALFMVGFWIFNDLGIRYIYGYALLVFLFIIQLAVTGTEICRTKLEFFFSLLVCIAAVFSLLPSSNYNDFTFALTISMLIFWFYTLFAKTSVGQIVKGFKFVKLMSLAFSVYIIITKLMPSLYWDYVFPRLSTATQDEANRIMHLGYGVPIGASPTYADYLISVGIFILFGEYLFLTSKEQIKERFVIVLKLIIFLTAMFFENRRSEVLMIIFTVVLLFILLMDLNYYKDFSKKLVLLFKVLLIVSVAVIICLFTGLLDRFVNTVIMILSKTANRNELSNGRIALWQIAWNLFKEKPLFGIGWEQFINYNYYKHDVHNSYLQFLCETGLVGFFLLIIPIAAILVLSVSQLRRFIRYDSEEYRFLKTANLVGTGIQIFYFLLNIIDPAFYHQNYFCFYSFSVILLNYCFERERKLNPVPDTQFGKLQTRLTLTSR